MTGSEDASNKQLKTPSGSSMPSEGESDLYPCLKPVRGRTGRAGAAAPLLAAIPLSLCLVLFPQVPLNTSWDGSWAAVLNQAHESGLQFGTQIVFPYGPLGYLLIPYFWQQAFWSRLLFTAALNFSTSTAICLVAWRLTFWWRFLSIGMFVLVAANIDYGVADFLLNVGLLCLGLLCLVEERPRLTMSATVLVLFSSAAALAKFSALMIAVLTVGAVAMNWFVRGRRLASLVLVSGWVSAGVLGWMILGQDLSHLPTYVARGFTMSSGYDQAMGLEPPRLISVCGFILAALVVQLAFLSALQAFGTSNAHRRSRRILSLGWLMAFLFVTWKHGFVRADTHHVVYFVGLVAVLAPLLGVLNRSEDGRNTGQNALSLATCMLGLLMLQFRLEPQYLDVGKPFLHLARNLNALFAPDPYFEEMNSALKAQRVAARLPAILQAVGTRPVDVFGNRQAFAALNELNLKSRPVFQSYAAYNEALMQVNEAHYLSTAAPQFVLFRLEPIDERFPPLEDARLLRLMLSKYEFAGGEGSFILLKARQQIAQQPREDSSGKRAAGQLTLLREGTIRAGERLNLAGFGETNLWVELRAEPTLAGRLRQVLYRPAELRLLVWGDTTENGPRRFRAPAPMLSAGFLASPLLLKTEDFAKVSRGCGFTRPSAFALEFGHGGGRWWKNTIQFRISKTPVCPGPSTLAAQVKNEANAQAGD
jgi:hypothetical protein